MLHEINLKDQHKLNVFFFIKDVLLHNRMSNVNIVKFDARSRYYSDMRYIQVETVVKFKRATEKVVIFLLSDSFQLVCDNQLSYKDFDVEIDYKPTFMEYRWFTLKELTCQEQLMERL